MERKVEDFFKHPYGDCYKNMIVNELMRVKLPYYPIFIGQLAFSYDRNAVDLLGAIRKDFRNNEYVEDEDPLYMVYKIEVIKNKTGKDKDELYKKLKEHLRKSNVFCLMDAYYDPSTAYANSYRIEHTSGHGRVVIGVDKEWVYYQTTHKNDPEGIFKISLDDMFLACESIIDFRFPDIMVTKNERHTVLKAMLNKWFVEQNYNQMYADMLELSDDMHFIADMQSDIEKQYIPNMVPKSRLFRRFEMIGTTRGATVTFLNGYMQEFGNIAYSSPIELLGKSLRNWKIIKNLIVKYAMTSNPSLKESMRNYLLEIHDYEKEAIDLLKDIITREMEN